MSRRPSAFRRQLVRADPALVPGQVGTAFQPAAVNEAADYAFVADLVERVAPHAVDEGTGPILDALLDHRTQEGCEQIEREYAQYVAWLPSASIATHAQAARQAAISELYAGPTAAATVTASSSSTSAAVEQDAPGFASHAVYWLGLLIAAGADVGAFYGVVALAFDSVAIPFGSLAVGAVAVGLTSVALIFAHGLGILLKTQRLGRPMASKPHIWLLSAAWLMLGVVTFVIRMHDPFSGSDQLMLDGATPPPTPFFEVDRLPMAWLFLALYLASGIATAFVAYLHHGTRRHSPGPLRQWLTKRALDRQQNQAAMRSADAAEDREVARRIAATEERLLESAPKIRDRYVAGRVQHGEKLKQLARVLIAQKGQDPALTDALFHPALRTSAPTLASADS